VRSTHHLSRSPTFQCPEGQGPKSNMLASRGWLCTALTRFSAPKGRDRSPTSENLKTPCAMRRSFSAPKGRDRSPTLVETLAVDLFITFQCPEGQGPKSNIQSKLDALRKEWVFQCPEGQGPKSNVVNSQKSGSHSRVSVPRRAGTEVQLIAWLAAIVAATCFSAPKGRDRSPTLQPTQPTRPRLVFQCPEGQGPKSNCSIIPF